MPILFAIAEAAKALGGISPWTLRKHVASGRLRVVRIGRRVFVDAEEIERIRREGLPSLQSNEFRPVIHANLHEENKNNA